MAQWNILRIWRRSGEPNGLPRKDDNILLHGTLEVIGNVVA